MRSCQRPRRLPRRPSFGRCPRPSRRSRSRDRPSTPWRRSCAALPGPWPRRAPSRPGFAARRAPSLPGFSARRAPSRPGFAARRAPSRPGFAARRAPSRPGFAARRAPSRPGFAVRRAPSRSGLAARLRPSSWGRRGGTSRSTLGDRARSRPASRSAGGASTVSTAGLGSSAATMPPDEVTAARMRTGIDRSILETLEGVEERALKPHETTRSHWLSVRWRPGTWDRGGAPKRTAFRSIAVLESSTPRDHGEPPCQPRRPAAPSA